MTRQDGSRLRRSSQAAACSQPCSRSAISSSPRPGHDRAHGRSSLGAEFVPLRLPTERDDIRISLSSLFAVALLAVSGTGPALLALVLSALALDLEARRPPIKVLFNAAQSALSVLGRARAAYALVGGGALGIAAGGVGIFLVNHLLVGTVTALALGVPPLATLVRDGRESTIIGAALTGFSPVVIVVAVHEWEVLPLLLVPLATSPTPRGRPIAAATTPCTTRSPGCPTASSSAARSIARSPRPPRRRQLRRRCCSTSTASRRSTTRSATSIGDLLLHGGRRPARARSCATPTRSHASAATSSRSLLPTASTGGPPRAGRRAGSAAAATSRSTLGGLRAARRRQPRRRRLPSTATTPRRCCARRRRDVPRPRTLSTGVELYDAGATTARRRAPALPAELREAHPERRARPALPAEGRASRPTRSTASRRSCAGSTRSAALIPPDDFMPAGRAAPSSCARSRMTSSRWRCAQCARWRAQGLHLPRRRQRLRAHPPRPATFRARSPALLAGTASPARSLAARDHRAAPSWRDPQRARERSRRSSRAIGRAARRSTTSALAIRRWPTSSSCRVPRSRSTARSSPTCSTSPTTRRSCESTIGLAHSLGLRAVAEGVEDQPTLDQLRAFDCDLVQGYLIAKPQAPEVLTPCCSAPSSPPRPEEAPRAGRRLLAA